MTTEEWATFCKKHSDLFALSTDADLSMLAAWRPLLGHFGLNELLEASRFLTGLEAASRKREHCGLMAARVRAQRRAKEQQWDEQGWKDRDKSCAVCRGEGILFMPHPQSVKDGAWVSPFYTCLIYCTCSLGAAKQAAMWNTAQKAEGRCPPPMNLDNYEFKVPNWQELIENRENQRLDQDHEQVVSEAADKAKPIDLAEARQRLANSFKMPEA